MAARKLQNEIDKTLKKVQEGSETFNEIYEKMMDTTHQAQKEKRRSQAGASACEIVPAWPQALIGPY